MYDQLQLNYPMNRSVPGGAFVALTVAQQIAVHACGYQRCIIRDVGICIGSVLTTPPTVEFHKRIQAGLNSTKQLQFSWTPVTLTAGSVYTRKGCNVVLEPGNDFIAEITVTTASGTCGIWLHIEPWPENTRKYTNVFKAVQS